MVSTESIEDIVRRAEEIEVALAQGSPSRSLSALSKTYARLQPLASTGRELLIAREKLMQARTACQDLQGDADLGDLAEEEFEEARAVVTRLEREMAILLLPEDPDTARNAIVEVRAGTGGDEAALFAGDLIRMYLRFGELEGWQNEILSVSDGTSGGFKEAIVALRGRNVYRDMRFESGVHRVQRVPDTESSGRIHTSAATVAVLPEPEAVEIDIHDRDLRIESFRASGAGGQHVNKTDSAVRLTHIPSGIVISQQSERSQHRNKAAALKILRARLFDRQRDRQNDARAADRRNQVGRGDRSERVRTYNFAQNRVTDHRINLTLYRLAEILQGEGLAELVQALKADSLERALEKASAAAWQTE